MKIKVKKIKVMKVYRNGSKRKEGDSINIKIERQVIELKNQFGYLGSLL